jgi:hypothetical protein
MCVLDRYDVRGTLHDLTPHEPPPGGYTNRLDYLSPAEQRAEQLCEEERYYSLYRNEVEEELYAEEAAKRKESEYKQVAFNYDDANQKVEEKCEENDADDVEDSEPFVPPKDFVIPDDIELVSMTTNDQVEIVTINSTLSVSA